MPKLEFWHTTALKILDEVAFASAFCSVSGETAKTCSIFDVRVPFASACTAFRAACWFQNMSCVTAKPERFAFYFSGGWGGRVGDNLNGNADYVCRVFRFACMRGRG